MPAYIVAGIEITDPELFQRYGQEVVSTVKRYGGTYVIRAGQPERLEGTWGAKRVSILEFPSAEQARAWYGSPEYSAIIGFRQGAAKTDLTLVHGGPPAASNWGLWLLRNVVHPFVIAATPLFLLGLIVYFVASAFREGIYPGLQSAAGALLPLIAVTYLFGFQGDRLAALGRPPALRLGFVGALVIGFGAMAMVHALGRAPITEVVLSAIFSGLVFCYASLREQRVFAYYYGMMLGILGYIVLRGFPTLP